MSPTMSALLLTGNLSEVYCTSECLHTYAKHPRLDDPSDRQSPRAEAHWAPRASPLRALGATVPSSARDKASGPLAASFPFLTKAVG